jgi:hypothetical protein
MQYLENGNPNVSALETYNPYRDGLPNDKGAFQI